MAGILNWVKTHVGALVTPSTPDVPWKVKGSGVEIKVPLPLADNVGIKPNPVRTFTDAHVDAEVNDYVEAVLADSASNPAITPTTGVQEMKFGNVFALLSAIGGLVGPLVSYADEVAPNNPGVQKLDAVITGVKAIAPTVVAIEAAAMQEWDTVFKPAVSTLVSAFADLKHSLEAKAPAAPAVPAAVAAPATAPATTPAPYG